VSKIEQILERATLLREGREARDGGAVAEELRYRPVPHTPVDSVFTATRELKVASPYLVSVTDPGSPVMEEYQKLKSVVVKLTSAKEFLNTVMVTSTLSGEGKSITALNLAVCLAQEYDHTVLLVDADLRRPSIGGYLGIKAEIGLSDCLMHGANLGDALVKTGIGKLSVLLAGTKVPNPVETLSSNKMRELIAELKSRYPDRYIIIDTPPLLLFAEGQVLASMADGVLFVVREGQVPMHQVKEALNLLKGDNLLGVVFNDVETNHYDRYHYYSNYADRK